jgi:hypothetical protein
MRQILLNTLIIAGLATLPSLTAQTVLSTTRPQVDISILNWEPPSTTANQTQIAIALIQKDIVGNNFQDKLCSDIERALLAKGYKVSRFKNYDEMTFGDKKVNDLVLYVEPLIDISWTVPPAIFGKALSWDDAQAADVKGLVPKHYVASAFGLLPPHLEPVGKPVMWKGTMGLSGSVVLSVRPSITFQEILMRKNIDLPTFTPIAVTGTKATAAGFAGYDLVLNKIVNMDPATSNAYNELAQAVYNPILNTVFNHLDPEEIKPLKAQADEIKAKKSY